MQRSKNSSQPWQKTVEEVEAAQVSLKLNLRHGDRHRGDCLDLVGKRHNPICGNLMSKERDGGETKLAFLAIDGKTVVGEALKDGGDMTKMILDGRTCHQNIVEIDKHKV